MADIVVTDQDRVFAENVLEQILTDALPADRQPDFAKGSAVRDLAINSIAYIFAYLEKEKDIVRARQSLLTLGALTGSDVDDAVDEILSNWFVTRKQGSKATGTLTIYLSNNKPVSIPATAMFYKSGTLRYFPDTVDSQITYGEDNMQAVYDESGLISSYTIRVPLIAERSGADYNIDPGVFIDFTKFSPYILRAENINQFSGGIGLETTDDMLERSETAISVRDLNSTRSIDATLKDNFSEIEDVTVIGYGDAEMCRDLILEEATLTRIHAGGHVDAYIRSPIVESQTFTGVVGGEFTDPRPGYFIFRDAGTEQRLGYTSSNKSQSTASSFPDERRSRCSCQQPKTASLETSSSLVAKITSTVMTTPLRMMILESMLELWLPRTTRTLVRGRSRPFRVGMQLSVTR